MRGDSTGQHLVEAGSGLWVTQQRFGSEDDQLWRQTGSCGVKFVCKSDSCREMSRYAGGNRLNKTTLELCCALKIEENIQ